MKSPEESPGWSCGEHVNSDHHTITVTVEPESVTSEFRCTAPVGADCRLGCGEHCAAYLNGDPCGHNRTRDEGFCLPVTWLKEDGAYWYELYDGEPAEIHSGPINVLWNGDAWRWAYPNQLPPPPERTILTDLLDDLRSEWHVVPSSDGYGSITMKDDGWVQVAADRANTRLKELSPPPSTRTTKDTTDE